MRAPWRGWRRKPIRRNTLQVMTSTDGIEWLGHAGFRLKTSAGWIYIDPYRTGDRPPADAILVTHGHFDHFSRDDVLALAGEGTICIAPPAVTEQLSGRTYSIAPGVTVEIGGV